MRLMLDPQRDLNFQPSNLRLTNEYYEKYLEISRILDANSKVVHVVHEDLKEPLKYATTKGKDGWKFRSR